VRAGQGWLGCEEDGMGSGGVRGRDRGGYEVAWSASRGFCWRSLADGGDGARPEASACR